MKDEIIDRFIKISMNNGIEIKDFSEVKDLFKKLGYKNTPYFSKENIGIVKAIAANSQEGNALIDVSDVDRLKCVIDVSELYIIIDKSRIFETPYKALKKADNLDYVIFIGGESKTADIEKQLVSGVQGAKKVFFVLI